MVADPQPRNKPHNKCGCFILDFLLNFTNISRPRKKRKAQPGAEAASAAAFTIKKFIGIHGQNIQRKLEFGLGPDLTIIGSLNSNMALKIEFNKN
jgi:hypothetical protein